MESLRGRRAKLHLLPNLNALWVRVWKAKYGDQPFNIDSGHRGPCSPVLQSVRKIWPRVMAGTRWSIRDGRTVKFWTDNWLPSGINLSSIATGVIPRAMRDYPVCYFTSDVGEWKWLEFSHLLPAAVLLQIAAIPAPNASRGSDKLYWSCSSTGAFSTKSAYNSLDVAAPTSSQALWTAIWTWPGPPRIRTFLWLLKRNRLLTNSERCRRHLTSSDVCIVCGLAVETALHVVRDCSLAKEIWRSLLPCAAAGQFFRLQLEQWISFNLLHSKDLGQAWDRTFGVVVWKLWQWRNEFIFQGKQRTLQVCKKDIFSYIDGLSTSLAAAQKLGGTGHLRVPRWIRWMRPPPDWVKLNSDGSYNGVSGLGYAGGLLRDENGNWLGGFTLNIGYCSIMAAELWGLFRGLSLAWDLGFRQIEAEVDNASVVRFSESFEDIPGVHSGLIMGIKDLLSRSWQVKTKHPFVRSLLIALFCAALILKDASGTRLAMELHKLPTGLLNKDDSKRSLIGSVAPTCTYNECRGCRFKCRAEQVPVEGNDPINSAYHYKCVCHR
ncbi:Polynucleotidyl transferase- ribonuclease H-like superfamily protein [Striga hermonthica]|uniref:Polynucleotidyl transferase- ribonuclease H-like superfamily protein n=1 Tax=Striga hermonthica TaxID=68872 RepID=A0A9N7NTV8_STRHE|nr:Polynucleotidyl transferase- ribonuclease H-like superfamily protein [Striga hermonthica]